MKAAPTLDGRIRIDLESDLDLEVLRSIVDDARASGRSIVEELVEPMDESLVSDWKDYVLPDLMCEFSGQLSWVNRVVREATPGQPIFIREDEAETWYGALNQARLALEECFSFGDKELEEMEPSQASARIRSHFYQILQSLLLDFIMNR
ncbi:MAG: DUF2017 family protein [Verrucomicrobiales bacterium]